MAPDYAFHPSLQYFPAPPYVGVKEKDAWVAQVSGIYGQDRLEHYILFKFVCFEVIHCIYVKWSGK